MFRTLEDIIVILKGIITELINISDSSLDLDASFFDLGINSVLSVDFVESINQKLGISLGVDVVFDYKGVTELARHILSKYYKSEKELIQNAEEDFKIKVMKDSIEKHSIEDSKNINAEIINIQEKEFNNSTSDIAIIGLSGKFADSDTIEEFWDHLQAGECCVKEIKRNGWNESYYQYETDEKNTAPAKWGGMLRNIENFDNAFFNISPAEASCMDPQQRLFLEETFKALEDSGYSSEQLSGKKVGVFVGARASDYKDKTLLKQEINAHTFLGTDMAILNGRLSYFLNIKGPSMTIDTACSSSLVAIHLACESIRNGESEISIAGGVFIACSPEFFIMTLKTEMLSPEGKCKTFDDSADGIVVGEGVGVLILKRLEEAINDGDYIYGVIKGSNINQDGRTKGITAPSMLSQKELIYETYKKANINPETISYIEAHGTGTKLGDPIEVKALSEAFRMYTNKNQFCAIGSHKPNFGHTIMAAGIAGIFKVLMAMKYKKIPPTIHINQVNQHINLKESPFFLNTELRDWKNKNGIPLRAGISSFGFSGTNCHIIIEEFPITDKNINKELKPYYFIPFSAKTKTALKQKFIDFSKWLDKNNAHYTIDDISYTLVIGRDNFTYRAAIIAKDLDDLKQKISEIIEKGTANDYSDNEKNVSLKQEIIIKGLNQYGEQLIMDLQNADKLFKEEYKEKLLTIANLYINYYDLNWINLFNDKMHYHIPLPVYPFDGDGYWLPEVGSVSEYEKNGNRISKLFSYLHPLVHQNKSNLMEQKFSSIFTGREFFLRDHIIKGRRMLPGVAYLEMVRAAVEESVGTMKDEVDLMLIKDVVWARPVIVGDHEVNIHIALHPEENGVIGYEIYGEGGEVGSDVEIYSQGRVELEQKPKGDVVLDADIEAIQRECDERMIMADECYKLFREMGFEYGPAMQGIERLYCGNGKVLAKLKMPQIVMKTHEEYKLHPSIMDGALQASLGLTLILERNGMQKVGLPFGLQELKIMGDCTPGMWVYVRYSEGSRAGDRIPKLDIDIADESGKIRVRMKGYASRILGGVIDITKMAGTLFLEPVWKEKRT